MYFPLVLLMISEIVLLFLPADINVVNVGILNKWQVPKTALIHCQGIWSHTLLFLCNSSVTKTTDMNCKH